MSASLAESAFSAAVDAVEPEIRAIFAAKNTASFRLPFPITFSGGDYHDEYERLILSDEGNLFLEDGCGNPTDVAEVDASTLFSAYQQIASNYAPQI